MKRKWHMVRTVLFMAFMLLTVFSATVHAAPTDRYSLKVEGTYYYSKAYEMLEYVNEERMNQGLAPLTMDKELTEAAMQRAAECAADFSHTRPNGTSCFSICSKMNGENIAAGNSTAQATFQQWMNSPGHKANMMRASFKSIGIGCFSWGGLHYWVQAFSSAQGSDGSQPSDRAVKPVIEIVEGSEEIGFNLNSGAGFTINVGESLILEAGRGNPGWSRVYCGFTADSFFWTSSNPSVASVDANGKVVARGVGDAVITAKPKEGVGAGGSVTVLCRQSIANAVFSEIAPVVYSGNAHTPSVTVTLNGKTLRKDTDYEISYTNNTNAGIARIRIEGKGNYTGSASTSFTIQGLDIANKAQYHLRGWNSTGFEDSFDCIEAMLDITYGGRKLECRTDYYIYSTSTSQNSSKVQAFGIRFRGNYTGSKYFSCLDDGYIKPIVTQIYTGKPIVPTVKVYINEGWASYYPNDTLTAGKDYEIKIDNNIQEGTARITITGIGEYYGTLTGTFKIVKAEHEYGNPVFIWNGTSACEASFTCLTCKEKQTVKCSVGSKTTAATCTKEGKTVYTATASFGGKSYTATKTVTINKAAHKYGSPVFTWNGTSACEAAFTCSTCKTKQTVKCSVGSKTTAATCTSEGKTVYTAAASFGGKSYTATKTVTINKAAHKYGSPVFTWNGTSACEAAFTCSTCKTKQTVKCSVGSKTTAATCTKEGKTVYTAAAGFGGKSYTATKTVTINKAAHKYGSPVFTWNGTSACEAAFTCSTCKTKQTVKCSVGSKTTAATCTKEGKTVYTATAGFGGKSYTATKTATINKAAHKYGSPVFTWNGTSACEAAFTCSTCNTKKSVKCTITSKTTAATCTKAGKTVYTATAKLGNLSAKANKTVGIKAKGHKYTYTIINNDKHKAVCKTCKKAVTAKHTYKNNTCKNCRAVKLTAPVLSDVKNVANRKITASWKKAANVTGYQIAYKIGSVTKIVKVKPSVLKKTFTNLTKGKTYKVYVRGYKTIGKVTYYSKWSKPKSVKITK